MTDAPSPEVVWSGLPPMTRRLIRDRSPELAAALDRQAPPVPIRAATTPHYGARRTGVGLTTCRRLA